MRHLQIVSVGVEGRQHVDVKAFGDSVICEVVRMKVSFQMEIDLCFERERVVLLISREEAECLI